MGKSVAKVEQTFPAREVDAWKEHYRSEPWGPWRDNAHAALIVAALTNIFRKKGSKPVDWQKFMLKTHKEHRAEDLGRQLSNLKGMARPGGRKGRKKLTLEQKRDRSGKASRKAGS